MKVSKRVDYGVRALIDLALHYGQGVTQSGQIAARQSIPEPYLEQLLATLRKAGIIQSKVGPAGGHALARSPDKISLGEVIAALEGSPGAISCIGDPRDCLHSGFCPQRDVWREIEEATQKMLNAISIGDLARKQQNRQEVAMYYI